MTLLSVVTTLYKSESYVIPFYNRVLSTINQLGIEDYQIIFVNDGSPDNSSEVVKEICKRDPLITFVDLSRNFGHHNAIMAGLHYAKGRLVWLLDSDLEEQPEWLPLFYKKLSLNVDADVIYGVQSRRKGEFFERLSGNIFYSVINYFLPFKFPRNIITARLMTQRYVHALLQYKESSFVIGGLWMLTGFIQIPFTVVKKSSSKTTYSFSKKLRLFAKIISSFSSWPLYAVFFSGIVFIAVSIVILAYIIFIAILSNPVPGWSSLMASIWFIGGTLLSSIGIIGIYIQKVFEETKRRPNFIVREVYESNV